MKRYWLGFMKRSPGDEKPKTVTFMEGRLISKDDNTAKIEIAEGFICDISGPGIKDIRKIEDKDSSRPFVEIRLTTDSSMNIQVTPQFLKDVRRSKNLPYPFAEKAGIAFTYTNAGHNNKPAIPGSQSAAATKTMDVSSPLGGWDVETTCTMVECTEFTRSVWGFSCDKSVNWLNKPDDPDPEIEVPEL